MDDFRNKMRKEVVDNITEFIRSSNIPDHITGFMLRTFHVNLPLYLLIFVALLPLKYAIISVVFAFIILISGIFFKGCVLTGVEKNLCKASPAVEEFGFYTVIDPFIMFAGEEVNKHNRFKYSILIVLSWFFAILFIFGIRVLKQIIPSLSLPISIEI